MSETGTFILGEYAQPYGKFQNVFLSDAEYQELTEMFPWDYRKRIEQLSVYIKSSPYYLHGQHQYSLQ